MKKYVSFLFLVLVSGRIFCQPPTPGQLKIIIESFKCINKSWDGFVELDGPGSEVFMDFSYRIYNPSNPVSPKTGLGQTPIFGSHVNGNIKAGTASPNGGIENGDVIPVNILALNEHIDADKVVLFSPSLWEWDNFNNAVLNQFNQQVSADLNWVMLQPYPFTNANISYDDPLNGRFTKMTDRYNSYWPILKYSSILNPLVNVQDNRPMGMEAGDYKGQSLALYNPALLILDTRALLSLYGHNVNASNTSVRDRPNFISGPPDFTYTENTYAVTTSNGSYTLKLRIEFTPDSQTASAPPVDPPKYSKQPPVNRFPSQAPNTLKTAPVSK